MPELKMRFERAGGSFGAPMLTYFSDDGRTCIDLVRISADGTEVEQACEVQATRLADEILRLIDREADKCESS